MCFPIWREDESCPTKPNPQMQPHLVPLSLRHGRAQRRPPPAAALTLSLHPAVPAIGFTFTAPPSLRAHLVSPAAATDAALNTMAFPGAFVRASRSGEKTSRAQPNPTRRCSRISFPSPSDTAAPTGSLSPPLPLPSPYPGPTSSRRGHGVPGSRGVSPWMGRRSESSMAGRADGDLADAGKNRRCHPSMADTQLLKVHDRASCVWCARGILLPPQQSGPSRFCGKGDAAPVDLQIALATNLSSVKGLQANLSEMIFRF
ncbi:uncharacterized protein [Triticum aestivum]|uniref:uncharacterized protein n=1 Tax=Triticum aestivum TaxID=4565 RepID=UPI001D0139AA|nr:uncharacterized protein LOC123156479 [Triticum aestivum]XP_044430542.1 uncharacterized protein LOC123156479 [Triticum aestivum]XP_044430543.1 uncharacterized protein LOC123156479 [Triticum aestivum]